MRPFPLWTALLALGVAFAAAPAGRAADSPASETHSQQVWRAARCCGANSLYLFLNTHGRPTEYQAIEREVPVGPQGTSLPQLRDAAGHLGLSAAILRGAPADLARADLPVIAHLDSPENGGGHFVLIVRCGADEVEWIDGTTALARTVRADEFRRVWTGYYLAPAHFTLPAWLPWAFSAALTFAAAAGFWRWRVRRPRPAPAAASLTPPEVTHAHTL